MNTAMKIVRVQAGAAVDLEIATFAARTTVHAWYGGAAVDLKEVRPGVMGARLEPPVAGKGAVLQWSVHQHGGSVWRYVVSLHPAAGEPEELDRRQGDGSGGTFSGDAWLYGRPS